MRKCVTAVFSVALSALAALPLSAQQLVVDQGIEIPSARSSGMGGVHVALADDLGSLFSNPAGFRSAGPEMSLAEVTLGLAGPIFTIADVVTQIMGNASPQALIANPSVQQLFRSLYASGTLNGPISFGYVGEGLGFGFFNKSGVEFSTVGAIPTVTANVEEDVVFCGGYALRIPLPEEARSTLDVGVLLKTFIQGKVELSKSIIDLFGLFSSISPDILLNQPFLFEIGAGLDFGVRFSWNKTISIGIVGRNLPTFTIRNAYDSLTGFTTGASPVTSYGYVPIDLSAGVMFSPSLGILDNYITNLKIFLDYEDILDFATHPDTAVNPILHVGFGIELTLLEVLSLRGGLYDGYFCAGLGLNLSIFRLNLSMFGRELSGEPGLRPVYNLLLGFEFKL